MFRTFLIGICCLLFGSSWGMNRDDGEFVSRKLKWLAEQLPMVTLPKHDTIVEFPELIQGKSVVFLYNSKREVRHIGISLFSDATKQMLDVDICNFLERFFLELLMQENEKAIERKLLEYHVQIFADGELIDARNAFLIRRLLTQMEMPVNFSLRQKENKAEAVWLFGSHVFLVVFPLYRELIDGMDKVESDHELFHQLQVAVWKEVHFEEKKANASRLVYEDNGLYVDKGETFAIPELSSDRYYTKRGEEYVPVFQTQYPAQSLTNLFLTYSNGEGKLLQITHRMYGHFTPEISIPLLNFLSCFQDEFSVVCHAGINKKGKLEAFVVFNHNRLNYIHLLRVETDSWQLFSEKPVLKADFYSNIPQHYIKTLLQ